MIWPRFHQKMISNIDQYIDKTTLDIHEEENLLKNRLQQRNQLVVLYTR